MRGFSKTIAGLLLLGGILAALPGAAADEATASAARAEVAVAETARHVISALKARDLKRFARSVHPARGVRFSPYAYVNPDSDVVLSAAEVESLFADDTRRQWGYYDGSGEPIIAPFAQYFDRFVYSHDFAGSSRLGYNQTLKTGNTVDNSRVHYPNAVIVEYHIPDDGMDWASLRLVFEALDGRWYVTGIIHDEWTI